MHHGRRTKAALSDFNAPEENLFLISRSEVNHVAFLVPSVRKASEALTERKFPFGPPEEWEGEGTLEVYGGEVANHGSLLLLMEPVKEGAYSRAMRKRGPGLHHVAIDVPDLDRFISDIEGSGWLLHPRSIQTFRKTKTIWLARPGMPLLVEVQHREKIETRKPFITSVRVPLSAQELSRLHFLGIHLLGDCGSSDPHLEIDGEKISFHRFGIPDASR